MEQEQDINPYKFLDEITASFQKMAGVDLVYFLDSSYQIVKKSNNDGRANYLDQVLNIINSAGNFNASRRNKELKTYTLLNEDGLILISKVDVLGGLYMVVIGGENDPVDLITLLKLVKEVPKNLIT